MDAIKDNPELSDISNKMKALLRIAAKVQQGGKQVLQEDIDFARIQQATDREIHDTVLIAAAFCMYNRYVDGLGTWASEDRNIYIQRAPQRAAEGYLNYDPNR
jgi:alkylhydroperoxidase/carboxymuconolactone decarboxylase family protein YurZ